LEKDARLPDARGLSAGGDPHALGTALERRLDDMHGVRRPECGPVRLEVAPLEPGAADLLGEEAVLDGVVDVFEKLAVDLWIDRADSAIRVDLEDRDAGGGLRRGRDNKRQQYCGEGDFHSRRPPTAGIVRR